MIVPFASPDASVKQLVLKSTEKKKEHISPSLSKLTSIVKKLESRHSSPNKSGSSDLIPVFELMQPLQKSKPSSTKQNIATIQLSNCDNFNKKPLNAQYFPQPATPLKTGAPEKPINSLPKEIEICAIPQKLKTVPHPLYAKSLKRKSSSQICANQIKNVVITNSRAASANRSGSPYVDRRLESSPKSSVIGNNIILQNQSSFTAGIQNVQAKVTQQVPITLSPLPQLPNPASNYCDPSSSETPKLSAPNLLPTMKTAGGACEVITFEHNFIKEALLPAFTSSKDKNVASLKIPSAVPNRNSIGSPSNTIQPTVVPYNHPDFLINPSTSSASEIRIHEQKYNNDPMYCSQKNLLPLPDLPKEISILSSGMAGGLPRYSIPKQTVVVQSVAVQPNNYPAYRKIAPRIDMPQIACGPITAPNFVPLPKSFTDYPLSRIKLLEFLEVVKRHRDPRSVAMQVLAQNNTPGALKELIIQLYDYFKVCNNNQTRVRISRLIMLLDDRNSL